jgi:hypothetical protein
MHVGLTPQDSIWYCRQGGALQHAQPSPACAARRTHLRAAAACSGAAAAASVATAAIPDAKGQPLLVAEQMSVSTDRLQEVSPSHLGRARGRDLSTERAGVNQRCDV